jgi:hypothetical protein
MSATRVGRAYKLTYLKQIKYERVSFSSLSFSPKNTFFTRTLNKIVASLEDCELDDNNFPVEWISEKNYQKFRKIHSSVADRVDN